MVHVGHLREAEAESCIHQVIDIRLIDRGNGGEESTRFQEDMNTKV